MAEISVVVPAFNASAYIAAALRSVVAQELRPAEIIVSDDGSTDGTADVARTVARDSPVPIRVLSGPNRGPATARNRGVAEAKGEWIAFLDADDEWLPAKLRLQVEGLERSPGAALSHTDRIMVGPDGRELSRARVHPVGRDYVDLLRYNFIVTSSVVVRREALGADGPFDPRPELVSAEDYALWLRVARSGRLAHVPEALVRYRIHDSGISRFPDRSYGAERAAVEPFLEEALRAGLVSRRFVRDRLTAIDFEHGYALLRCGRRAAARRFLRAWIGSPSRWRALGLAALALIRPRAPGGA